MYTNQNSEDRKVINLTKPSDRINKAVTSNLNNNITYTEVDGEIYPSFSKAEGFNAEKYQRNLTSNYSDFEIVEGELHIIVKDDDLKEDTIRLKGTCVDAFNNDYRRNTVIYLLANHLVLCLAEQEGSIKGIEGLPYNLLIILMILNFLRLFIRLTSTVIPEFKFKIDELLKQHPKFIRFIMGQAYGLFDIK